MIEYLKMHLRDPNLNVARLAQRARHHRAFPLLHRVPFAHHPDGLRTRCVRAPRRDLPNIDRAPLRRRQLAARACGWSGSRAAGRLLTTFTVPRPI
jgi:hypothetical protein